MLGSCSGNLPGPHAVRPGSPPRPTLPPLGLWRVGRREERTLGTCPGPRGTQVCVGSHVDLRCPHSPPAGFSAATSCHIEAFTAERGPFLPP